MSRSFKGLSLEEVSLVDSAELGVEVESFLETKLGKYLIERAEQEREAAQIALMSVPPTDVEAIRALQFKAQVANGVLAWFAQAIQDGRNADIQLQYQEYEANVNG